jgi:DNA-binding transcriptional LysR family regulator
MVAVAEQLNYRKAAELLRVARPALSTQIMDLEEELGVKLFDRDTGGVRLTSAGASFLENARAILRQAQAAMVAAREAASGERGRLTVGYMEALSAAYLAPKLAAFRKRYPKVEVTVRELILQEHIPALLAGDIDVGFTFGPCQSVPETLQHFPLLRTPMRVAVGPGHRLARLRRIALAELSGETFVCLSNPKRTRTLHAEQTRAFLAMRGIAPGTLRPADGFESLLALISSGAGVAILPELMRSARTAGVSFKPIKESGPDLFAELAALCRQGESFRIERNFISILAENVARPALSRRASKRP